MIYVNARFLTQKLSGVQRFAIEIGLRLKKEYGKSIVFVTPNNVLLEQVAKDLDAVVIGKHQGYLWEQWDLPRYLKKKETPLLLNLCNLAPVFYRNNIVALHDIAFKYFPSYGWKFRLVYGYLIPRLLLKSKHIITVSQFSKQEICRFYKIDPQRITVVYNAVNDLFKNTKGNNGSGQKYIFTVSSRGTNKNFITTLRVFQKLSTEIDDLQLYAVGKSLLAEKYNLFRDYADNPKIKFLGSVTDEEMLNLYSGALAFVYPSIYEGFGIPPLEAQSCGCPVVASNGQPLPEVLGDTALHYSPMDVDGLAEGVMRIYKSTTLRNELIEKGHENVKRFSWDSSAKIISDLIKNNTK